MPTGFFNFRFCQLYFRHLNFNKPNHKNCVIFIRQYKCNVNKIYNLTSCMSLCPAWQRQNIATIQPNRKIVAPMGLAYKKDCLRQGMYRSLEDIVTISTGQFLWLNSLTFNIWFSEAPNTIAVMTRTWVKQNLFRVFNLIAKLKQYWMSNNIKTTLKGDTSHGGERKTAVKVTHRSQRKRHLMVYRCLLDLQGNQIRIK